LVWGSESGQRWFLAAQDRRFVLARARDALGAGVSTTRKSATSHVNGGALRRSICRASGSDVRRSQESFTASRSAVARLSLWNRRMALRRTISSTTGVAFRLRRGFPLTSTLLTNLLDQGATAMPL